MLMTHYRQPMDLSVRGLEVAEKLLDNWYRVIGDAEAAKASDFALGVDEALRDDLNTPAAITHLHTAYDAVRESNDPKGRGRFKLAANRLGLLLSGEAEWKSARSSGVSIDSDAVDRLIAARLAARKAKDWKESDRIRDELAAMGIQLKDVKDPATGEIRTEWEVKR
jgi:cysteinyl-tRNA synthetase